MSRRSLEMLLHGIIVVHRSIESLRSAVICLDDELFYNLEDNVTEGTKANVKSVIEEADALKAELESIGTAAQEAYTSLDEQAWAEVYLTHRAKLHLAVRVLQGITERIAHIPYLANQQTVQTIASDARVTILMFEDQV